MQTHDTLANSSTALAYTHNLGSRVGSDAVATPEEAAGGLAVAGAAVALATGAGAGVAAARGWDVCVVLLAALTAGVTVGVAAGAGVDVAAYALLELSPLEPLLLFVPELHFAATPSKTCLMFNPPRISMVQSGMLIF